MNNWQKVKSPMSQEVPKGLHPSISPSDPAPANVHPEKQQVMALKYLGLFHPHGRLRLSS